MHFLIPAANFFFETAYDILIGIPPDCYNADHQSCDNILPHLHQHLKLCFPNNIFGKSLQNFISSTPESASKLPNSIQDTTSKMLLPSPVVIASVDFPSKCGAFSCKPLHKPVFPPIMDAKVSCKPFHLPK
jgi:hypothetical protein